MQTTTSTWRCRFCTVPEAKIWMRNEHAVALADAYPLTEGHTLVLPTRHLPKLFDCSDEEYSAVWALVAEVRKRLQEIYDPDGFNIAVNDGPAAGQTVMHAHVHVIPRRIGDVIEPRGGIRWIMPERAPYWEIEEEEERLAEAPAKE